MIRATMSQKAMSDVQSYALKQNVATLHNRINELGVAEPVIAQQGADVLWFSSRVFRTRLKPRTS